MILLSLVNSNTSNDSLLLWAGQLIAPDAKKNIKNFTYDFIDDPVETTKNVGKAISNTANNVISSIGGNISNMINSTTSSLGWFR